MLVTHLKSKYTNIKLLPFQNLVRICKRKCLLTNVFKIPSKDSKKKTKKTDSFYVKSTTF